MILHEDCWVELPAGRLFARQWMPMQSPVPAQGSPIVLFHDSLGSVELWRNFPSALSARTGRTVVAYDRLGFGRSAPRDDRLGIDFIAAEAAMDFATLRAQFGIDRFVACGHSVGGGMAVHCAAQFGDACAAVITVAAQAFVEDRTLQGIREAQALFADPAQVERLAKYHGDKARWVLNAWLDTWLSPQFAGWSLDAVLPRVTCPLLAIHGSDDEYGSPRHPELIGRFAGGPARVEVMPATHHMPHREREAAVLDLVAEFLRSID